jgi:type II secretory pathway pseudopilin PulG
MSKVSRAARLAQSGLTLIETAMVLGISSLVIAAALSLYATTHDNERTATALVQMNTIQQAVRVLYGQQATFTGLTSAMLISARTVPLGMINGAVLRNAFGGGIAIGTFDNNGVVDGGFTVTFDTVPVQSCVVLATKDYGRALAQLLINDFTFDFQTDGVLPTAQVASVACGTTPGRVSWLFKN